MNGGIVWRYVSEDRHVRCIVNKIKLVAYQRIPRHCDTRWRDGVYYSTVIIIFFYILITNPRERAHSFRSIGNVKWWDGLHCVHKIAPRKKSKTRRIRRSVTRFTARTKFNVALRTCFPSPLLSQNAFKDASSLISIIFFECRKIFDDDFMLQL